MERAKSEFIRTTQDMVLYLEKDSKESKKTLICISYDPDTAEFFSSALGSKNNVAEVICSAMIHDKTFAEYIEIAIDKLNSKINEYENKNQGN